MIDEEYLSAYFGKQADYYLDRYRSHHSNDKFTFNTGAFLMGILWFLYRKLYFEIFIILLLLIGLSIIEAYVYDAFYIGGDVQAIVYFLSVFFFATGFGFMGNYFYLRKTEKVIIQILKKTDDHDERLKLLRRRGGVTWMPFIVIGIIIVILAILNN